MPLTAEERRTVIRSLGRDYNVLVETGTSVGDTPWELRNDFKLIHTIELDRDLYRNAEDRLKFATNITCWCGDSGYLMPFVLAQFDEAAVFWLDGHYCGPGSAHGPKDTPIVEELGCILDDAIGRGLHHLILIDDARIFGEGPEHDDEPHYHDYPTLTQVREMAEIAGYRYELSDDIIRLFPPR